MNAAIYQQTKPVGAGNSLVMAIYKASAPTILVASYELPGPYTGQTQLHTFLGLQAVVHKYQLFESPDGTPTGVIRNYFDIEPNNNTFQTRDPLYLTADISSFLASGTNFYGVDASLIGWNWYLERIGQGTREVGIKYVKTKAGVDTTQDDTDADGWRLLVDGDLIGENEEWCIHFLPQLGASTTTSTSDINGVIRLTANTTLDNTAARQAFLLQGSGGYFEVTLNSLASFGEGDILTFTSVGGSHVNVAIKATGDTFEWYKNKADLASITRASRIVLGQGESLKVIKYTSLVDSIARWLVLNGGDNALIVGDIIDQWSIQPLNTVFADRSEVSRTTYARLWEFVNDNPDILVDDSQKDALSAPDELGQQFYVNRGKFTRGDGLTTFRLPMLFQYGFRKAVDGTTRKASSFERYDVGKHVHEEMTFQAVAGGAVPRKKPVGFTDVVVGPIQNSGYFTAQNDGEEERPNNIGIYALIRT